MFDKNDKQKTVILSKSIIMYTKPNCVYCQKARELLAAKKLSWEEIDISGDLSKRTEMIDKSFGATTVPQIFINSHYVGGYSDLFLIERQKKLDALLYK